MDRNNNDIDWGGWVLTLIMLALFWPVGLFLLFRMLMGRGKGKPPERQTEVHPISRKRS